MAYNNRQKILYIISWFKEHGYTDNFIIGLLGNIQTETASSFDPKQVQLSYLRKYNITSTEYIAKADDGTWLDAQGRDFCNDRIGTGLCQWTSVGRKTGLYNYAKSVGKSVGDLQVQCEWINTEINSTGYATCRKANAENWTFEECARTICEQYERPASMTKDEQTKATAIQTRISNARAIKEEFFKETPVAKKKVSIMLDAGHDGKRNQSPVFPSYYESVAMFKLQGFLKKELESRGFAVGITRTSLNEVKDVVARGKASKGYDLFISLHSNACGTESVDRVSGIFLANDDTTGIDEQSKKVSELLTEVVKNTMGITQKSQNYYKLAGYDRNGNGITTDDDYYGVLYGCHSVGTAGIILEHSFHTNKKSAMWLYDESNLKALAVAESNALSMLYYGASESTPSDTAETPVTPTEEVKPSISYTTTHKVVKGDTLYAIARKYNTTVSEIMALNPIIVNKASIQVGWVLTIPTNTDEQPQVKTYVVEKGDGLIKIANKLKSQGIDVKWQDIANANGLKIPYTIKTGQVLIIP